MGGLATVDTGGDTEPGFEMAGQVALIREAGVECGIDNVGSTGDQMFGFFQS